MWQDGGECNKLLQERKAALAQVPLGRVEVKNLRDFVKKMQNQARTSFVSSFVKTFRRHEGKATNTP